MKCKHCEYEWQHKGIGHFAQCPRCRKYTKVILEEKNETG